MYLKSLELQGFKSFPDKTELKFNKGITAVVGPNGSGKSNIADAMRWVMGEQSSKALRGEKMAGVIFHGCNTRKQSPFSQVTITIDNEDRALGYDSDIVSVSRKLYRNGDSEYMINGKDVKLKEINELFMDTGLGKDGYSIIGQGRIADIVNGKSNDRREIFEEAAGIAKFRYKKQEAERKLVAAEDNISRLNDIIGELESRIEPLRKQCEKAKRFRELDDEKRTLEVSVWVCRLDEYKKKLDEYDDKIGTLKEEHKALSDELEGAEREIEDNFQLSALRSAEADGFKDKIHLTELENKNAASDIAVYENDIHHLENNILQLRERIERSRADKYFLESELEKRKEQLCDLTSRRDGSSEEIADKENQLSKLAQQSEQSDKSLREVNSAVSAAYLKKSALSFQTESIKNSITDVQDQLSAAEESAGELEKNSAFALSERKRISKQKQENDEKISENENRLSGLAKLYEKRREKLASANEEYSRSDTLYREISGKLQILRDLENSMEGFGRSVKFIMKSSAQGRLSGICGSVAQLIRVSPEYTVAVETALGGALQNIVTENEDAAKRGIRLLKENSAGRATFLPVTSVKGARNSSSQLEKENGYVAMGCDLVECDGKFSGIINYLLGRICIAEDMDSAAQIAAKNGYRFKIVTLDGQVVNAGGSFTGGSVSKSAGILTRKNEISQLEDQLSSLNKKREELTAVRERLTNEVNKFAADTEGLKEQLNALKSEGLRLDMELKRADEYVSQYAAQTEETDHLRCELKKRLADLSAELDTTAKQIVENDKVILDCEAKLSVSQNEQDSLRSQREELSKELSELKIGEAEINKDISACRDSITQLNFSIESSENDNGKTELDILDLEKEIAGRKDKIKSVKEKIAASAELVKEYEAQAQKAQREHLEYNNAAVKLRTALKSRLDEKETLMSSLTRTEERRNASQADFDKLVTQLWDEYELTRTTAAEIAEKPNDLSAANKRLSDLKNQIKSLGSVNLGAIEEYAEVSERYEFMNGQLNDVNTSKSELCSMIDDLTEKMKSVFMQNFDSINANFRNIFAELFGGGKGELILTDPENVLECGIEINVQPPGKVITNLMSLSGGEQAMVAIAIYFAILKNSPSPFCLLDEIEAALDDVNVTRYAQYLHRLTDRTQFITITHRRGTMEEADVLYGVTMQEKGISKLLKMSSEETRQMKLDE